MRICLSVDILLQHSKCLAQRGSPNLPPNFLWPLAALEFSPLLAQCFLEIICGTGSRHGIRKLQRRSARFGCKRPSLSALLLRWIAIVIARATCWSICIRLRGYNGTRAHHHIPLLVLSSTVPPESARREYERSIVPERPRLAIEQGEPEIRRKAVTPSTRRQ